MPLLIKISVFSEDLQSMDWEMIKAATEQAKSWGDGDAQIHVYPPERDGTKHYSLVIWGSDSRHRITIGVLKRPGSNEVEFHS